MRVGHVDKDGPTGARREAVGRPGPVAAGRHITQTRSVRPPRQHVSELDARRNMGACYHEYAGKRWRARRSRRPQRCVRSIRQRRGHSMDGELVRHLPREAAHHARDRKAGIRNQNSGSACRETTSASGHTPLRQPARAAGAAYQERPPAGTGRDTSAPWRRRAHIWCLLDLVRVCSVSSSRRRVSRANTAPRALQTASSTPHSAAANADGTKVPASHSEARGPQTTGFRHVLVIMAARSRSAVDSGSRR